MHNEAINELTISRDIKYNNAAVAHAEGRTEDRDRLLNEVNSLSATLRELQGIREPELPFATWIEIQVPDRRATGETPIPEMPVPEPDKVVNGWVMIANGRFLPYELAGVRSDVMEVLGYHKATAHIYLDKP